MSLFVASFNSVLQTRTLVSCDLQLSAALRRTVLQAHLYRGAADRHLIASAVQINEGNGLGYFRKVSWSCSTIRSTCGMYQILSLSRVLQCTDIIYTYNCTFLHSTVLLLALKMEETYFTDIVISVPVYKNITSQDTEVCMRTAKRTLNISPCICLKQCGIVTKIRCQQFGWTKAQLNNFGSIKKSSQ